MPSARWDAGSGRYPMREIISISTILFLLAVAGTDGLAGTGTGGAGKTCTPNLIVALVSGC